MKVVLALFFVSGNNSYMSTRFQQYTKLLSKVGIRFGQLLAAENMNDVIVPHVLFWKKNIFVKFS